MQPILYNINAFDANGEGIFTFSYQGNQAIKNRLIIRNNTTNEMVYDVLQVTYQLKHTVSSETLINGICYNAQVCVYDLDDNVSAYSNKIIFYCYSYPTFGFTNLQNNQIVRNSSYEVFINYEQNEDELLDSTQFILYNSAQQELLNTNLRYGDSKLFYVFSGLDDSARYYIRAYGETVHKFSLDTGLIPISVNYINPSTFSIITLENLDEKGHIKISSNIIAVTGIPTVGAVLTDDGYINLKEEQASITFDDGFEIDNDFTIQLEGKDLTPYSEVLILKNNSSDNIVELKYMFGKFESQSGIEKAYVQLRAYGDVVNYYVISNYIDLPDITELLHIWIRRIDNIYELVLTNKGEV